VPAAASSPGERGVEEVDIGKPRRIHRVEPLRRPVPERLPEKAPDPPKKVPAK
jgi:hypothetical protein